MSVGDLKTDGLKGNNFPWQLKMLNGQQCACDYLQAIDLNTDEIEPLLLQILLAIQSGQDYEAMLVVDANDITWLEIRVYNPDTGTFDPPVYYLPGSNTPGIPLAPLTYINPNTYLAQIVSNTAAIATSTAAIDLDTTSIANNTTSIDINTANIDTNTVAIDIATTAISADTTTIVSQLNSQVKTPVIERISGVTLGISVQIQSISIACPANSSTDINVSTDNGVNFTGLYPGETVYYDAGTLNNYFTANLFQIETLGGGVALITYII